MEYSSAVTFQSQETLGKIFDPPLPEAVLERIFASFDDNMDGFIDAREFICGLSLLCRGEEQKKLKCKTLVQQAYSIHPANTPSIISLVQDFRC